MDSQWLKALFESNPGKSKAGLAAAIGLEPPAISKILNGTRQIKAQEYISMRKYFGLPVDGEASIKKMPPPLAVVAAPPAAHDLAERQAPPSEWMIPPRILSSPASSSSEKTRIFKVNESVMEPDFRAGENVLVDLADRTPSPPGVFMISDGFGNMIRHCGLIEGSDQEVRISARDRQFQAQTLRLSDFLILGRVVGKLQML